MEVSRIDSQMLGWLREFLADPEKTNTHTRTILKSRLWHNTYSVDILIDLYINFLSGALLAFDRSPMKAKARGNVRNKPLLYIVNVTTKYMARLPNRNNVFTAVQYDISSPNCRQWQSTF